MLRFLLISCSVLILILVLGGSAPVPPAFALSPAESKESENPLEAFATRVPITLPALSVPTVVDLPITDPVFLGGGASGSFGVFEESSQRFQPARFLRQTSIQSTAWQALTNGLGAGSMLFDQKFETFIDFPAGDDVEQVADIRVTGIAPFTATGITLSLDRFVALPRTIEVRAGESDSVVLARSPLMSETIRFPETRAQSWHIILGYVQPLRLTELAFFEENPRIEQSVRVRFLARPGERYTLYLNADRPVRLVTGESPDFSDNRGVVTLSPGTSEANPTYRRSDSDRDGIADLWDNCVLEANSDQADADQNGRGDACDDFDRDRIINARDNCLDRPNADQRDTDADKRGDACDSEESRFTERFPWAPAALIALAAIFIVALFISTFRHMRRQSP